MANVWTRSITVENKLTSCTLQEVLYALICLRGSKNSDKATTITESHGPYTDNHLHYNIQYKIPEFMRLIFGLSTISMHETIQDFVSDAQNPHITANILRVGRNVGDLQTLTKFTPSSDKSHVTVVTKLTIVTPFQIPTVLHKPLENWMQKKILSVREDEQKIINFNKTQSTLL